MASLASLVVDLVANTTGYRLNLDRARKDTDAFVRGVTQSFRAIDSATSGLVGSLFSLRGVLATVGGTGGLGLLSHQALTFASDLKNMSERVGIGIERLQALQFAARQTGASTEELETALRTLNRVLGEAGQGQQEALALFGKLGISVSDSAGNLRDAGDVLGEFADHLQKTASPAERARLAITAFGRDGTRLLPMLQEGRAGLEAFARQAQELGLIMDASLVKEGAKAADQAAILAQALKTDLYKALISLRGPLLGATGLFRDLARSIEESFTASQHAGADILQKRIDEVTAQIQKLEEQRKAATAAGPLGKFGQAIGATPTEEALRRQIKTYEDYRESLKGYLADRQRANIAAEARPGGGTKVEPPFDAQAWKTILSNIGSSVEELGLAFTADNPLVSQFQKNVDAAGASVVAFLGETVTLGEVLDQMGTALGGNIPALEDLAKILAEIDIKESVLGDTFDATSARIEANQRAFTALIESGLKPGDAQVDALTKTLNGLQAALSKTIAQWVEWAQQIEDEDFSNLTALANLPISETQQFAEGMKLIAAQAAVFGSSFDAVGAEIDLVRARIVQLLGEGFTPMSEEVQDLAKQLDKLNRIKDLEGVFHDVFSSLDRALTTSISGVMQGTQTLEKAFANMGQAIALGLMESAIKRGIQAVEKALDELLQSQAVQQLIQAGLKGLAGILGVTTGPEQLSGPGSGYTPPATAAGGVVMSPQTRLVGEAGPEAIVPLSEWGGKSNVEININVEPGMQVEQRQRTGPDGRQIRDFLVRGMKDAMGSGALDDDFKQFGVTRRGVTR